MATVAPENEAGLKKYRTDLQAIPRRRAPIANWMPPMQSALCSPRPLKMEQ